MAGVDDSHSDVPAVVPARMLNEHIYCPRLAYLEWVDCGFRESADTVEGTFAHRRVDRPRGRPPEPGEEAPPSTSIWLASERLGVSAKIDLLEPRGTAVVPIEFKRGHPTSADAPLHEPELVQLCAQAMLLRDAGYRVDHAEVYFAETRTRHHVPLGAALEDRTLSAIDEVRASAARAEPRRRWWTARSARAARSSACACPTS
jgi:CRISP-associated protein Cas1